MEECVRRNETEGKEINPVTCNFVKKCKPGEVRNEQGRCTKKGTKNKTKTQNKPIPFAPYVYTNPLEQKKRVTYNRKKAKEINRQNGNTFSYNVGRAGRRRKTAKLYANHPLNTRTTIGKETRNSLNLENAKRGKPLQAINEAPEALANLEQELGELDESNMRPLQVRKRAELKKKAEELAGKRTPINERKPKKRRAKSENKGLSTSLNSPTQANTEL
jgi:hypothetical protein